MADTLRDKHKTFPSKESDTPFSCASCLYLQVVVPELRHLAGHLATAPNRGDARVRSRAPGNTALKPDVDHGTTSKRTCTSCIDKDIACRVSSSSSSSMLSIYSASYVAELSRRLTEKVSSMVSVNNLSIPRLLIANPYRQSRMKMSVRECIGDRGREAASKIETVLNRPPRFFPHCFEAKCYCRLHEHTAAVVSQSLVFRGQEVSRHEQQWNLPKKLSLK